MEICKECGQEVGYMSAIVKLKQIPFYCKTCGALHFKFKATGDKVFVWPDPVPDKIGKEGLIVIPEKWKERNKSAYGTVLTVGPGCISKDNKRFIKTELKVGDYVMYDINVPWSVDVFGVDDKRYVVPLMGELDIKVRVVEDASAEA